MTIVRHRQFSLRRYTAHDLESLVRAFGHPQVLRGARGVPGKYQVRDGRRFLREKLRQYRRLKPRRDHGEAEALGYAIERRGQLVGGVGLTLHGQTAEIHYWLARSTWGQGLATAVVRLWTHYVVGTFAIRQVEAYVFAFNRRSVRVLEKNGFRFKVRLVRSVKIHGQFFDDLVFVKRVVRR